MLEMVKEAEKELLRYPGYSGSYYVKRILKQICGRKVPRRTNLTGQTDFLPKHLQIIIRIIRIPRKPE